MVNLDDDIVINLKIFKMSIERNFRKNKIEIDDKYWNEMLAIYTKNVDDLINFIYESEWRKKEDI
jgi:hypothetical protein